MEISPRSDDRLTRFLEPGLRQDHTRSRDILKPIGTTGLIITLNVSQLGTGALRVFFQFRDNLGNYKNVFQSIAVNQLGDHHYLIHPQATAWPDITEFFVSPIPTVVAVNIRHTNPGDEFQYSVHGQFI